MNTSVVCGVRPVCVGYVTALELHSKQEYTYCQFYPHHEASSLYAGERLSPPKWALCSAISKVL